MSTKLLLTLSFLSLLFMTGCRAGESERSVIAAEATLAVPTAPTILTPTLLPSPTAEPSATPTAAPSATPAPRLRQLTTGGCCVNPVWRADGQAVQFLDRPRPDTPAGLYEVRTDLTQPAPEGTLVTEELGSWALGGRYYLIPDAQGVTLQEVATGARWRVATQGNTVSLSPDATLIAWQVRDQNSAIPFNERQSTIWVANRDGSEARVLLTTRGGSFSGWVGARDVMLLLPDDNDPYQRLLLRYRLSDGSTTLLARAPRLNGLSLSPDGKFLLYYISLEVTERARNGLWLTDTESGETRRLPFVGAYQWRDATHLLVIPMEMGAPSHRFQEYDLAADTLRDLTDPATLSFRVTNNDWTISPNGSQVVFVSAADGNLWVLGLER